MGRFKYPFRSRMRDVPDHLVSALATNFDMAATSTDVSTVSSGLAAHLADTDDAHDASAVSVTETGIIVPSATTVQQALRQVEAYVQNLEERFEQHHHDDRYAATTRFKVGAFSAPAGTGNYSVSGLGFRPSLVTFSTSWINLGEVIGGRGAMDAAGNQHADAWHRNAGVAQYSAQATTAAVYLIDAAGPANLAVATFVSMDADGFTVNFTTTNTNVQVRWIAYR